MKKSKQYTVFISHSSKERWIARQMSSLIESKGKKYGVKTFLDERDIKGGDSFPESIRKNIRECNEIIVLLSRNSINRQWILIEIGAAFQIKKRIIAILNDISPDKLPDVISLDKAIDLNNFDDYLKQLLNRTKEYTNANKAKRKN